MRFLVVILIFMMCFSACNSSKGSVKKQADYYAEAEKDTIIIENKELEYEIIIVETGFQSWLVTQPPMTYYTQSTLEVKNKFYVMEWNQRVISPQRYNPNLYQWPIDYDQSIDYGMEVNYLLYMYFEFFQKKYRQRL